LIEGRKPFVSSVKTNPSALLSTRYDVVQDLATAVLPSGEPVPMRDESTKVIRAPGILVTWDPVIEIKAAEHLIFFWKQSEGFTHSFILIWK
jgi:hypothetical protein